MSVELGSAVGSIVIQSDLSGIHQAQAALRSLGESAGSVGSFLRSTFSFAAGELLASSIRGAIGATQELIGVGVEAYASHERLGMSLESLIAAQISRASGIERTIVVGQQQVELTKKEAAELTKLTGSIDDEIFKRDQLSQKIGIAEQQLAKMESAEKRNETAIASKRLQIEAMRHSYDQANGTIAEHQGRIAELTNKSSSLVDVTKTVREGQISVNDAMGQASPVAERLVRWVEQLAINSPFDEEGVSKALRTAAAYGFVSNEVQGLLAGQNGIKQAQEQGLITQERLTQGLIDYASGSGQSSAVMEKVALALGQIRAKGKLAGQEVLQLTEAGISVDEILARAFGKSTKEIVALREAGLIPADQAIKAIVESLETDFAGAAQRQATSFEGLLTSLSELKRIGLREFFTGTLQAIQPYLAQFVSLLSSPEMLTNIRTVGDQLGLFVRDTMSNLSTMLTLMREVFGGNAFAGDILEQRFGRLGEILGDVAISARRVYDAFQAGGFSGAFSELGSIIGEALTQAREALAAAWPGLLASVAGWGQQLWNTLLGGGSGGTMADVGGAIGGAGGGINDQINGLITSISNTLMNSWPTIETTLGQWSTQFWNWVNGPEGVTSKTAETMDNLLLSIETWANNPATALRLSEMGTVIGRAIMTGLQLLFQKEEETNSLMATLATSLGKAVLTIGETVNKLGADVGAGIIEGIIEKITGGEVSTQLRNTLQNVLEGAFKGLNPIAGLADSFNDLSKVGLPSWLTPGSPTPFENGLRGITSAISQMPDLSGVFNLSASPAATMATAAPAMLAGGGAGSGGGVNLNGDINITVDGSRSPTDVARAVRDELQTLFDQASRRAQRF